MEYENCTNDWNVCFQEIRVVPVTLDGKYAFLYASGCAENSSLTAAELSEAQFMEMCTKQGLARCRHQYSHGHYKGTFCCEQNDVDVLKSWLFGIFFGDSEEMMYELEATVQYVEKENTGKRRNLQSTNPFIASFVPFLAVIIFTLLALLQFYHINDGVIS
uniref:Uncharacterized protein n=1 Tax=Caenorhabditis japonica TaxID=281687 RepID=A0A8R1IA86_CAEJA